MARRTIGKARTLVKREIGISAAALEKTPGMNGNPNYPWYWRSCRRLPDTESKWPEMPY